MAFHVRDRETDELVRRLLARTGQGLTDTVRALAAKELERLDEIDRKRPLIERIKPIQDRIAAYPDRPFTQTDKEFWDEMSGDY